MADHRETNFVLSIRVRRDLQIGKNNYIARAGFHNHPLAEVVQKTMNVLLKFRG